MAEVIESELLVERPSGQRVWVVRASGGAYTGHFSEHGLVAIGHIDVLGLEEGTIASKVQDNLSDALRAKDRERSKSSITSHANQVKTFISSIKENDLVVTVSHERLYVGRVTGPAYIAKDPLIISRGDNLYEMKHHLRRAVQWGPSIPKRFVPASLEMTMLAHQTVFNIDEFWDSIYHLLYPCFYSDGKLYLSAYIKQAEDLDNYSVSQFFSLLSGIEAMAKSMDDTSESWKTYPSLPEGVLDELNLNLTSKAEFMSPGAVWAAVAADGGTLLLIAAIYVMIFGGDIKIFKSDGLIDLHTRQKLWDRVLKLSKTHSFPRVQKKLKIETPKAKTKALQPPKQNLNQSLTRIVVVDKKDPPVGSDDSVDE